MNGPIHASIRASASACSTAIQQVAWLRRAPGRHMRVVRMQRRGASAAAALARHRDCMDHGAVDLMRALA